MPRSSFLFAPGAGASSSSAWMQYWKRQLETIGPAMGFDYPYMREKRKRPDPLPQLIRAHREALAQLKACRPTYGGDLKPVDAHPTENQRIVLIGKSMGGRIGCHVALEENVDAVICFGYPLCAMGDRSKLREQVLRDLRTRILFIQGTRDALCPLDLLTEVRATMQAPNELHLVEGGDHSLQVTKGQLRAAAETQEAVNARILAAIRLFVEEGSEER